MEEPPHKRLCRGGNTSFVQESNLLCTKRKRSMTIKVQITESSDKNQDKEVSLLKKSCR